MDAPRQFRSVIGHSFVLIENARQARWEAEKARLDSLKTRIEAQEIRAVVQDERAKGRVAREESLRATAAVVVGGFAARS